MNFSKLMSVPRDIAHRLRSAAPAHRRRPAADRQEILEAALEALHVARDNKAIVVTRAGVIIDINERALHLCGRDREDILGRLVSLELFASALVGTRCQAHLKTRHGTIAVD